MGHLASIGFVTFRQENNVQNLARNIHRAWVSTLGFGRIGAKHRPLHFATLPAAAVAGSQSIMLARRVCNVFEAPNRDLE